MLNRYRQVSEGQEKGEKGESSFFFFFNDLIQLRMYYTNAV